MCLSLGSWGSRGEDVGFGCAAVTERRNVGKGLAIVNKAMRQRRKESVYNACTEAMVASLHEPVQEHVGNGGEGTW